MKVLSNIVTQETINLTVLGIDISFRVGADMSRVKSAVQLLEQQYAVQKTRSHGGQNRDVLLTFLALGLADELLQSRKKLDDVNTGINGILSKIEGSQGNFV